jgi:hypothetical protein
MIGIGQGFKPPGALLVLLGAITIIFGMLPGITFFIPLPSLRGEVRKPIPRWHGRLWFVAIGALLIYLGVTHWRK